MSSATNAIRRGRRETAKTRRKLRASANAANALFAPPRTVNNDAADDVIDATVSPPHYDVVNGWRFVRPYHFTFTCAAKARWVGRSVGAVTAEFAAFDEAHYQRALSRGAFTVNAARADWNQTIRAGDVIAHTAHRHEDAIRDAPLHVIHTDGEWLALVKPFTWPVHAGRNRHNTLIALAHEQLNIRAPLHVVHRLDRAVGGVMVFAKTPVMATAFAALISTKRVRKYYVARVRGHFADDTTECSAAITARHGPQTLLTVGVEQDTAPPATGGERKVRAALSRFRRIAHCAADDTSIVVCSPLTGRTHQLRLHLQHVGHAIVHDTTYGFTYDDKTIRPPTPPPNIERDDDAFDVDCEHCRQQTAAPQRTSPALIDLFAYAYRCAPADDRHAFNFTAPTLPLFAAQYVDARLVEDAIAHLEVSDTAAAVIL